jgi:hypothetical protein
MAFWRRGRQAAFQSSSGYRPRTYRSAPAPSYTPQPASQRQNGGRRGGGKFIRGLRYGVKPLGSTVVASLEYIRRRNNQNKIVYVQPQPSGAATRSTFTINYKRSKDFNTIVKRNKPVTSIYIRQRGDQLKTEIGGQNQKTINVGVKSDWVDTFETVNNVNPTATAWTSTTLNKQKLYPIEVSCQMMIANADLVTSFVTLYICVPRKSTATTADSTWTTDLAKRTVSTVHFNANRPTVTPYSSPYFTRTYKVLKTIKLELTQGCSHIQTVRMKCNRTVYGEEFYNDTAYVPGRNFQILVSAYGAPIHDSANEDKVSTGTCQLDIVSTFKFKATRVAETKGSLGYISAMGPIENQEEFISQGGQEAQE